MKQIFSQLLSLSLVLALCVGVSACGQKGPLIVDKPETEQVTTQEEALEETK
ncbi:LPS translocon maturation chaperone LptM [Arenicella xantha]|uniref:Putative small lipoprotein YifL n=1 Tax=Arenicella xantha TaxID=644221 RepID=A0A395JP58_9GAMM|nr:lipoprotein [Arenicella xantha]RBP53441.1 putative small lipoprotein YifL [Arenicella xantha]